MSIEYLIERKNEQSKIDKASISKEFYCNTCRVISGEKNIELIDSFERNIPEKKNKSLYFPSQFRRIEKEKRETGIIFTMNSSLYKSHEIYLNKKFEEGDHDCGVYNE